MATAVIEPETSTTPATGSASVEDQRLPWERAASKVNAPEQAAVADEKKTAKPTVKATEAKPKEQAEKVVAPEGDTEEAEVPGDEEKTGAEGEDDEDEETSEEEKQPVPYTRFSEVNTEKNVALEENETLRTENERLSQIEAAHEQVQGRLSSLYEIAQFDTRLREFLNHWAIAGREPTPQEIENPEAHNFWKTTRAEREAEQKVFHENASRQAEQESEQKFKQYVSEEDVIRKKFGSAVTDDRIADAYDFLSDLMKSGRPVAKKINSLERAFLALNPDAVLSTAKEEGRTEATTRINRPKAGRLKPGSVAAPKEPSPDELSRMPLMAHIRAVTGGR